MLNEVSFWNKGFYSLCPSVQQWTIVHLHFFIPLIILFFAFEKKTILLLQKCTSELPTWRLFQIPIFTLLLYPLFVTDWPLNHSAYYIVVYIWPQKSLYGSTVLLLDLGLFFSFLILYTVGRTPWTGNQPVSRILPKHSTAQTQNNRKEISMSRMGFETKIQAFERAKTVHLRPRGQCDRQSQKYCSELYAMV
jgi:hypothetical protein